MKGKFNSLRDSALYSLCLDNWSTGEFGDTEHYGGYVWQIDNEPAEVSRNNTEANSVLSEWFEANPEQEDTDEFRAELVGHFLIIEGSTGVVTVVQMDSKEQLSNTYGTLLGKFLEWQEATEA